MTYTQKGFVRELKKGVKVLSKRFFEIRKVLYLYLEYEDEDYRNTYSLRLDNVSSIGMYRAKIYTIDNKEFTIKDNSLLDKNLSKLIISKIKNNQNVKLSSIETAIFPMIEETKNDTNDTKDNISIDDEETNGNAISIRVSVDNEYYVHTTGSLRLESHAEFVLPNHDAMSLNSYFESYSWDECFDKMNKWLIEKSQDLKQDYLSKLKYSKNIPKEKHFEFTF